MMVKIIYILGFNHSGTTLVNQLLGSQTNAFSVGEINHLAEALKEDGRCVCGDSVRKDEFWGSIVDSIDVENLVELNPTTQERIEFFFRSLGKQLPEQEVQEDLKLYREALQRAKQVKGSQVTHLVDNSKSLVRLMKLYDSPLNFTVLHVVRDGRGVVRSHEKRGENWLEKYLRWLIGNWCMEVFKEEEDNYVRISYDKLAQNPEKHLETVSQSLPIPVETENIVENINNETFHTFSGNPMRERDLEEIYYKNPENGFSSLKKHVLDVLTYYPNRRWIY